MRRSASSGCSNYFDDTVVQQEAYRELLSEYMDIDTAARDRQHWSNRGRSALHSGPHSLIGAGGLLSSRDQIPPPTADQAVLSTLKRRLDQDDVLLACMNCRDWKSRTVVSRVPDHPQCPKCGAVLLPRSSPMRKNQYAMSEKNKEDRRGAGGRTAADEKCQYCPLQREKSSDRAFCTGRRTGECITDSCDPY